MAQTYVQLQKQIEALQRQADQVRQKEIEGVISRIKIAIDHYGLTAEQLGLHVSVRKGLQPSSKSASSSARYSDGNGNTWSGRGPRPGWLKNALASGTPLAQLESAAS